MILYSFALTFHYIFYVLLLKFLSNVYSFKQLYLNTMLIKFILGLILFPSSFITKFDFNYLILILFALNYILGIFIWFNASKQNIHLGKLDGIAIAIYLPILTLLLYILYNEKIKKINYIGIIFLGIGSYLTLL